MSKKNHTLSRREFISNAALIGASTTLGSGAILSSCTNEGSNKVKYTPLRPVSEYHVSDDLPDKAIDGKPLKAALIGCGSRGNGAALNFLEAANGLSVVACADIFKDRMDWCRSELKKNRNNEVSDANCFLGFDAYKKVCELPEVDLVLIATPTLFHAEQVKYAIENGKHVFCEKPAAIDAVGFRNFITAVKQAQSKNLCIVTGTQRHHDRGYIESYKKVQEGYIGRIISGNVYWNCSTRFSDGFRYGFGAEVGVSTGKLHARGPVGLAGLLIYKYLLIGNGHIVEDYAQRVKTFKHNKLNKEYPY